MSGPLGTDAFEPPHGTCPACGGRAPVGYIRTRQVHLVATTGAHKPGGAARHNGRCPGAGQPPVPGSVR